MIKQSESKLSLEELFMRRKELQYKLKDHFCLPIRKRNYVEFETVARELDDLRKKIHTLALIKK